MPAKGGDVTFGVGAFCVFFAFFAFCDLSKFGFCKYDAFGVGIDFNALRFRCFLKHYLSQSKVIFYAEAAK